MEGLKEVPFKEGHLEVNKVEMNNGLLASSSYVVFTLMLDHILFTKSVYDNLVKMLETDEVCKVVNNYYTDIVCVDDLTEYQLLMELD